jgi:ribose transport system permease protein
MVSEARGAPAQSSRLTRWVTRRRDVVVVYTVLVAMIVAASLTTSSFATSFNLQNVVAAASVLALVAVGQTFVMLTGGIDLSVGSVMSFITVIAATYMNGSDGKILSGILLCVGFGALFGLANGLLITVLRVQPIIATLGAMTVIQGITLARSETPTGMTPPSLQSIMYEDLGPLPKTFFVLLVAFTIGLYVLRRTRYGMRIYALGADEDATRRSGVPTARLKVSVYVISGVFAALAGLLLAARLGQGDPLSGKVFMLTSIAAVAIGGTSLFGGRGGLAGTLAGVLILSLLSNIMVLSGVATYPQQLITGLLVIVVVGLYSARSIGWRALLRPGNLAGRRTEGAAP